MSTSSLTLPHGSHSPSSPSFSPNEKQILGNKHNQPSLKHRKGVLGMMARHQIGNYRSVFYFIIFMSNVSPLVHLLTISLPYTFIDGPLIIILAILGTYALFPNSFAKKFLFFQHYDATTQTYE